MSPAVSMPMLDLDLGNDYRARGTFTYSVAPELAASPVVIVGAADEPHQADGRRHARTGKGHGQGAFRHHRRHQSTTAMATPISKAAACSRSATAMRRSTPSALRAGYEISPALTPFVETEIGRNLYDQEIDSAGFRARPTDTPCAAAWNSTWAKNSPARFPAAGSPRISTTSRLEPLSTPTLEADLTWSPQRGTDVTLAAATILEGTTTAGESGSVLYASSIDIERQIRANLTGNANFGAGWRNYSQSDGLRPHPQRRGEPDLVAEPLRRRGHARPARNGVEQSARPRCRDEQHLPGAEAAALSGCHWVVHPWKQSTPTPPRSSRAPRPAGRGRRSGPCSRAALRRAPRAARRKTRRAPPVGMAFQQPHRVEMDADREQDVARDRQLAQRLPLDPDEGAGRRVDVRENATACRWRGRCAPTFDSGW